MSRNPLSSRLTRRGSGFFYLLLIPDMLLYVGAMYLAFQIRFGFGYNWFPVTGASRELEVYQNHFILGAIAFICFAHQFRVYEPESIFRIGKAVRNAVRLGFAWGVTVLGIALFLDLDPPISRVFCGVSMLCLTTFLVVSRMCLLFSLLFSKEWLVSNFQKRLAVVGTSLEMQRFVARVNSTPTASCRVVGVIKSEKKTCCGSSCKGCLGTLDDLEDIIDKYDIEAVMIGDTNLSSESILNIAKICERSFVDFLMQPSFFEVFTSCLKLKKVAGLPVMGLAEMPQNRILSRFIKRMIDVVGSIIGLAISLPFYIILIPLHKYESPGPVFYKQIRVGQKGKHFTIYKLRSMRLGAEANGEVCWSTKYDSRRTKVGTFMRKWNLDEIPQFWNVLRGDMSLVGPRPERPELIEDFQYSIPYYQSRHSVRPGMTGWAQIHGLRGDTSIEDRIRHDLHYIENWSPWLDVVIQVRTLCCYRGAC